ncbi:SURF1 family protein [Brachybacterium endophyticum]|uniref:SURF1-like protein n=1 Tax=Brachybacterium endophyticum TaxID=2182385 RepID=A0A2U2RII8_9MICO|nr:SURF1 family protein [Brachybacterium endophyticum]PWH05697.1 SURF1 family protein [Brachybacterium endophyticum]
MRTALLIIRRLVSRDGATMLLAAILAAALCVGLGFWQWHRFETKRDNARLVETNMTADPVALPRVLPDTDSHLAGADEWKQVELRGQYCTDPDCVLYVRNRPSDSSVGFWQLVPFTTDQGTLLVVRGWVDVAESSSVPATKPPVPHGTTTAVVRMRDAEPVLKGRTNPPGQVQTVTPSVVAGQLPDLDGPLYTGAYGELASESPAASPMPASLEGPDTSLGPHLSYAVQWWLFAAFFPVAVVVRTRRQILDEAAESDSAPGVEAEHGTAQGIEAGDGGGHPAGSEGEQEAGRPAAPSDRDPRRGQGGRTARRGTSHEARPSRRRSKDEEEEDELLEHRQH